MRRLLMILLLAGGGCEESAHGPTPGPVVEAPPPAAPIWQTRDGSAVVAVRSDPVRSALAAAVDRARATAPQARERWAAADDTDRGRWAVKWEAETLDGGVEHLWVRPGVWSPFRIEGILASPPQRELLHGAVVGDPVAFPVESLSDWLYEPMDGPREGGFTIEAIEGDSQRK